MLIVVLVLVIIALVLLIFDLVDTGFNINDFWPAPILLLIAVAVLAFHLNEKYHIV